MLMSSPGPSSLHRLHTYLRFILRPITVLFMSQFAVNLIKSAIAYFNYKALLAHKTKYTIDTVVNTSATNLNLQ
jgi:hypothetical protein